MKKQKLRTYGVTGHTVPISIKDEHLIPADQLSDSPDPLTELKMRTIAEELEGENILYPTEFARKFEGEIPTDDEDVNFLPLTSIL